MQIPLDVIQIREGRRELDMSHVQELAGSIRELGLLNPITIDQENKLIAGLHRLEAAKMLGWTEIECTISGLEGLQAELAEIDENIVRSDLSVLEFFCGGRQSMNSFTRKPGTAEIGKVKESKRKNFVLILRNRLSRIPPKNLMLFPGQWSCRFRQLKT